MRVKVKRVRTHASPLPLPGIQTSGSAGCDLFADIDAPLTLKPKERILVPTGIAISLPKGFEAQVRPRSGWAWKYGITVANAPGTIDSDYRGEIKVILINLGDRKLSIQRGDRVAQLVFQQVFNIEWQEVSELDETERSAGGFGHTGTSGDARV